MRELPDVVITGVALTSALATDAEGTWTALLDGRSGIRALSAPFPDDLDLPVRIGGQLLEDFDAELTRVELRRPWCWAAASGYTQGLPTWTRLASP
jgi:beta-ketoacyl ACP synthase